MDGSDNVAVSGRLQDTVDFGNGPLTSAGGFDIFVANFPPWAAQPSGRNGSGAPRVLTGTTKRVSE